VKWIVLVFLLFGCSQKTEPETWENESIQELLLEDKENKKLELIFLEEIRIAQENDDQDAYEFYFQEYLNVPRLDIPDHLKQHPDYFIGGVGVKY
tara:strand:+ start:464 stop:748 length:285 start_codon:yes stop_codon:yes gene_type:complete